MIAQQWSSNFLCSYEVYPNVWIEDPNWYPPEINWQQWQSWFSYYLDNCSKSFLHVYLESWLFIVSSLDEKIVFLIDILIHVISWTSQLFWYFSQLNKVVCFSFSENCKWTRQTKTQLIWEWVSMQSVLFFGYPSC